MTTPMDLAQRLAGNGYGTDVALGVAIATRALTDDTDERQGWPLDAVTVEAAAKYVGVNHPDAWLIARVLELAPTLSDAILNKGAAR